MKILRRDDTRPNSRGDNGHNGDDSGSDSDKPKLPTTREEREARYEAARKRIMGSAKPEDDPPTKEKEESRSSSAAGKKKSKKQRSDSEDGFEARSAYTNFAAPPYASSESQTPMQYYPMYNDGISYPYGAPPYSNGQTYAANDGWMQHGTVPTTAYGQMHQVSPAYSDMNPQRWPTNGNNQPGYDMNAQFQQSMSFQNHNYESSPVSPTGPQYAANGSFYPSADYRRSQSGQSYYPGMTQSYGSHGAGRADPYLPPFGFNGPQFNPQSQAFIPGHPGPMGMGPPQAHTTQPYGGHLVPGSSPYSLQRQYSSQSQASSQGSNHAAIPDSVSLRGSQPMTHPLPQPVFSAKMQPSSTSPLSMGNSISKWERPPSLPAKPPPPANDMRFNRNVRTGPPPSGTPLPQYHHLPPMPTFSPTYGIQGSQAPGFGSQMPSPGPGQANIYSQR